MDCHAKTATGSHRRIVIVGITIVKPGEKVRGRRSEVGGRRSEVGGANSGEGMSTKQARSREQDHGLRGVCGKPRNHGVWTDGTKCAKYPNSIPPKTARNLTVVQCFKTHHFRQNFKQATYFLAACDIKNASSSAKRMECAASRRFSFLSIK